MKCNYKNRNSEGNKGFQALESYTKSLMPAVRAIETTMEQQYIVDSTTCYNPETEQRVKANDFTRTRLAFMSAKYADGILKVWDATKESDKLKTPKDDVDLYKLALAAFAPGGKLAFEGEDEKFSELMCVCTWASKDIVAVLKEDADLRKTIYGAIYKALLQIQESGCLQVEGRTKTERFCLVAVAIFQKLFTATTSGIYPKKETI